MSKDWFIVLMWPYAVICAITVVACVLTGQSISAESHGFDVKTDPTDFWIQIGGLSFSSVAAASLAIWTKNSD